MKIGFDIISDLNLTEESEFNWEDKATSLYLIIAGNVSSDVRIVRQTLLHLSKFYQGVFYIPGSIEYDSMHLYKHRTDEIKKICRPIKNVALLDKNVVVINGVAVLGANGWYGVDKETNDSMEKIFLNAQNIEDVEYLKASIAKLQLHLDVKKIILVSSSVPGEDLFFGEKPANLDEGFHLQDCLEADSEGKIVKWVFGSYGKQVDTTIEKINYVNNPFNTSPYWAKRIEV